MKKQWFAVIVSFLLVLVLCLPPGEALASQHLEAKTKTAVSKGVSNIVKRAYQMTNIRWTPKADIDGWNSELTYKAGTTYTGLPYGQPVYASYVPWSTGLSDFIAMVNDPNSKMYTSYSSYEAKAPYYSTDCSAFVSWAWGLGSRQTTRTIKNFATEISTTSYEEAEIGDCLCLAGSHVVLITDITYDGSGTINSIEISESTVNAATNYCCQKTRYGVGGSYTLDYLTAKYFSKGYILYRSNTRDNVTYNHCCAVPLEGDICATCGLGDFEETAIELKVICAEDVTLYAMPNLNADQLGTIYAGNEIVVIAYSEDDSGMLWYKTADGEWIIAAKTSPICEHDYSYSVTTAPTCTEDGSGTYACTLCGDTYADILPATGHSYQTTVIDASCENAGYSEHICINCGDRYHDSETPAFGHRYENGVCTTCGATENGMQKGDVNQDGETTSADSVLLARYLADLQSLNDAQKMDADVNNDGYVTSTDAVLLARYLAGLSEID